MIVYILDKWIETESVPVTYGIEGLEERIDVIRSVKEFLKTDQALASGRNLR